MTKIFKLGVLYARLSIVHTRSQNSDGSREPPFFPCYRGRAVVHLSTCLKRDISSKPACRIKEKKEKKEKKKKKRHVAFLSFVARERARQCRDFCSLAGSGRKLNHWLKIFCGYTILMARYGSRNVHLVCIARSSFAQN